MFLKFGKFTCMFLCTLLMLDFHQHPQDGTKNAHSEVHSKQQYHPSKDRVAPSLIPDFIRKLDTGDLKEVPGIGDVCLKVLKEHGISTSFQLFGQFLALKEEGMGQAEHSDRFVAWLKSIGAPPAARATIEAAIRAKVEVLFPGIYGEFLC
jgi:hypothetical protein